MPKNRLLHRILADKRVVNFGKRYLPERLLDKAKVVRNDNLEKKRMAPEERAVAMAALREDILRTGELVGQDLSAWLRQPESKETGRDGCGPGGARRNPCLIAAAGPGAFRPIDRKAEFLYERGGGSDCRFAKGVRPTDRGRVTPASRAGDGAWVGPGAAGRS